MESEGYPKLADLQAKYPMLAIYRRFAALNARNLLYLQAELVDLEDKLNNFTVDDIGSNDPQRKRYSRNWFFLSRTNEGIQNSQWYTMNRVKDKLREYNECLIQQRQLAAFEGPEAGNLQFLKEWLLKAENGNRALEGLDRNVWETGKDLVVKTSPPEDSFTRFVRQPFIEYYHRLFSSRVRRPTDVENGLYLYDEQDVLRIADIVGTLICSSMPAIAVVVLYFITSMLARLGMVTLFTILFSLALMLVTRAKRIEVFAATAAFASVQVVFVGSTSG